MARDDANGEGESTLAGRLALPATNTPRAARRILHDVRQATSEANAAALTDLRDIVLQQLALLKSKASRGTFSNQESQLLINLAKTHKLVSDETVKEHANYLEAAQSLKSDAVQRLLEADDRAKGDTDG